MRGNVYHTFNCHSSTVTDCCPYSKLNSEGVAVGFRGGLYNRMILSDNLVLDLFANFTYDSLDLGRGNKPLVLINRSIYSIGYIF